MRAFTWMASLCVVASLVASAALAETAEEKAMAQKIAAHLKQSGQLKNYRVGVKYQDGVAWLLGSVTSDQQRHTAVRLTEQMPGISHVVSKLEVPDAQPAGDGMATDFAESLRLASANMDRSRAGRNSRQGTNPRLALRGSNAGRTSRGQASRGKPRPLATMRPISQADMGAGGPRQANYMQGCPSGCGPAPVPGGYVPGASGAGMNYDQAHMPGYAWPTYASYPNYAALTYPRQYSPTAWPYIGPFYPYPQVPLGWRRVALEWDDGWWFLDFSDCNTH